MELYTLIKIHLGGSQNCLEYIYVQNFTTIDGKFLSASSEQWGLNLFQKLTKMATKDWATQSRKYYYKIGCGATYCWWSIRPNKNFESS